MYASLKGSSEINAVKVLFLTAASCPRNCFWTRNVVKKMNPIMPNVTASIAFGAFGILCAHQTFVSQLEEILS